MNDTELLALTLNLFSAFNGHLTYIGGDSVAVSNVLTPQQEAALIARKKEIAWPEEIPIPAQ